MNLWQTGTVHWYDELSGEGYIKDATGRSYFFHDSALVDSGKEILIGKAKVQICIIKDVTFSQVSKIKGEKV